MSLDTLLHLAEIIVVGAPLWWGAFRIASILRDFPPHRHVGRDILYPKGYGPSQVGHLNGVDKAAAGRE